jgi:uncharacterized protein (TIGR02145 family)
MRKVLLLFLTCLPFLLPAQNFRFKVVCNNPILNDTLDISISPGDSLLNFRLFVNDTLVDERPVYSYDPYTVSYPIADLKLKSRDENVKLKFELTGNDGITEEQELAVVYKSLPRQAHKDALLIANNEYRSRYWKSLSAPIDETTRLMQILRDQFGFQTKMITNASRNEIIGALYELSRKSDGYKNPYDQLLVYYSGHGEYDSVFNIGYIVPSDGTSEIGSYISYLDLGQILNSISYNHVLFISDACFSGTFFLHNADLGDTHDEVRNLSSSGAANREALMSRSRLAITSTSPATVSPAKSDLAASLLRILSDPYDNFIDFAELKSALTAVAEGETSASQIHCKGFGNNSIQGTFLFIRSRTYLDSLSRHDGESCGTVKDYDGNEYTTTRIGQQCWLREDMRSTHYADGTPIPIVDYRTIPFKYGSPSDSIPPFPKDQMGLLKDTVFAPMMFMVPNHDEPGDPIVIMYNWPAAARSDFQGATETCEKLQGVCPDGWHLPSDCEWQALQTHLETSLKRYWRIDERVDNHRYIAKSLAAQKQWRSSTNKYAVGKSLRANDGTRMSMLPAGAIGWKYGVSNNYADYWSSTRKEPFGEDVCHHVCGYFYLSTDDREVWTGTAEHFVGMCVRCVKDDTGK